LQYNDGVNRLTLRTLFVCATLLAVTAVSYANALRGAFQYDDFYTILINPHLRDLHTFIDHLDHMVRPVLHGTFLLDRFLYENTPVGYHLLNLLLHLASGCLVYLILTWAVTDEIPFVPFWTALDCSLISSPPPPDGNRDLYFRTGLGFDGVSVPLGLLFVY